MRTMPRVYRNFEELEQAEARGIDDEIDLMIDEMFADELDIDFRSKQPVVCSEPWHDKPWR